MKISGAKPKIGKIYLSSRMFSDAKRPPITGARYVIMTKNTAGVSAGGASLSARNLLDSLGSETAYIRSSCRSGKVDQPQLTRRYVV